ncbi:phage tail assembly chaperone [Bradyrhizobium quebecense]|uniref:Phage tail assembly chaperone-like domain-containing protein n=1 Tax=Bradyrhizobium quebecense TaxID=2748629 RepID=A0A973WUY5_9BRAD|nr:phage tail assembly chaperone [Bradyrhizobium quebecense]UGA45948.1 phage tail assembly chaperone [Bradyrhizobium quebecense]
MTVIHYCTATGFIRSWGTLEPVDGKSHLPNHAILRIQDALYGPDVPGLARSGVASVVEIDPFVDMVDLATLTIVKRPAADQAVLLIERLALLVKLAVAAELSATDQYMVTDRNVANRETWAVYRQQLRDLSKQPDAPSMVRNWPCHPTGAETPANLRQHLARIDAISQSSLTSEPGIPCPI